MSYQTGVAADPNDLINILIAFLTGAGWTIDSNALQLSGRICYLTKGSKHIALRSTLTSEGFNNYNGS
ncbi:MAG TPA: hypothetical protein VJ323_03800, partial [Bryobacteraceae bacterium]|nr:hypothetical protein [Bryobacteraceae bacterium]